MRYAPAAVALVAAGLAHAAETHDFLVPLPEIGTEFFFNNDGIPMSNDFNGGIVVDARIDVILTVEQADPGTGLNSDAAHFNFEAVVPVDIESDPGVQAGVVSLTGTDAGWSGTGEFTYSAQLDHLIGGTWVSPLFYTASNYPGTSATDVVVGTIHPFMGSWITITVEQVPAPGSAALLGLGGLVAARRRR